jgi:malate dehydrogenase (oxaloacetate-decarboxylating)
MPQVSTTEADAASLDTSRSGYELLADPLLNKGTAFSESERDSFDLHGLLPPTIGTLEEQVSRRLQVLRSFATDVERYAFLRDLQDTNETLFFALLVQNLEEMLPVVYTPTVGAGCQQFSRCSASRAACFSACRTRSASRRSSPTRASTRSRPSS